MSDIENIGFLEKELKFSFEQNPNFDLGSKKKANYLLENKCVKKLQLYKFNLEAVPEIIGNFRSIEYLELAYCSIKSISNINNLNNLKELYLYGNSITQISGLDCLKSLEKLDLSNNLIKKIENLSGVENLKWLNLSNNSIKIIAGLNKINLNYLSLANNSIRELPNNYNSFSELDIKNNQLNTYSIMLLNNLKLTKKVFF